MLVRVLEVGDEDLAEFLSGTDGALGKVKEPRERRVLEGHGDPVGHYLVVAPCSLDRHGVELHELERFVSVIVAWREIWLELDWPDEAAQLAVKGVVGPA